MKLRQDLGHGDFLLDVRELTVEFRSARGWVPVVNAASFGVRAGETVAVVGESGSGKTVMALAILGLTGMQGGRVSDGSVLFAGADMTRMDARERRSIRGDRVGMIFQQPFRSLNPAFTIGDQVAEVLRAHRESSRKEAWARAVELLDRVHIPDARKRARDYPHTFSGGMLQRAMIAMALACDPDLVIADEPTTALDVTVQATILDLLDEIQLETDIAVLLVSHDLGIVAQRADRVVVMYAGTIVEQGTTEDVFLRPQHPYTAGLLGSIPRPGSSTLVAIPGNVPSPGDVVPGCRFHPRCAHGIPGRCDVDEPQWTETEFAGARCIRVDELSLRGLDLP